MMKLNIQLFASSKTITKTIKDSYGNSYTATITINESLPDNYIEANKTLLSGTVKVSNTGAGGAYTSSKSMNATITFKAEDSSGETLATKTGNCSFDFQGNATKTATPLTYSNLEIAHATNGSRTVYISVNLNITETSLKQNKTWTDTLVLTDIPRASELDSFTSTNKQATYGYTKKYDNFYDVITFTSNGQTLAVVNNPESTAGTYTNLTQAYTMANVLAASTAAGTGTITVACNLATYTDSSKTTQIGTTSVKTTNITLGTDTVTSASISMLTNGNTTAKVTFTKWDSGTYDKLFIYSSSNISVPITVVDNVVSNTFYSLDSNAILNAFGTNTTIGIFCVIRSYTEQNGTLIGSSGSAELHLSLPAYSISASVNSYSDLNNSTQPGSMANPLSYFKPTTQTMIKYLSNPKITYQVASSTGYLYGRKISTSGAVVQTNLSHNDTFDFTIGTNPNASYVLDATDGRKTGSVTQNFTVVPYFIPTVTCTVERPLPTSTTAEVTIVAEYYNDSGSLLTNKKAINNANGSLVFKYTEDGGSEVTKTYSDFTITNSTSSTKTTMTATLTLTGLNPKKALTYNTTFKDLITYQAKDNGTVPSGQPALDVYRYNDENYVKANGNIIVDDKVYIYDTANSTYVSLFDDTTLNGQPLKVSSFSNDAGYINQIKTINNESLIGSGNINLASKERVDGNPTEELTNSTSYTINDSLDAPINDVTQLLGNTTQSGTPTPSSPVNVENVTGLQEIKAVGKNLFDKSNVNVLNGYVNYNTGVFTSPNTNNQKCFYIKVEPSTTYTWSGYTTSASVGYGLFNSIPSANDTANSYGQITSSKTITTGANDNYLVMFYTALNTSVDVSSFQLEKNSSATNYEPYIEQVNEINLGKNLFDKSTIQSVLNGTNNDGLVTSNTWSSGSWVGVTVTFTPMQISREFTISMEIRLTDGSTGTFSKFNDGVQNLTEVSKPTISTQWQKYVYKFTPSATYSINKFFIQMISINGAIEIRNMQLEYGSQATEYVDYFTPIELCKIDTYQDKIFKTSGKNLFSSEMEYGIIDGTGSNVENNNGIRTKGYIPIEPNTTYYLSNDHNYNQNLYYYDSSFNYVRYSETTGSFTTPNGVAYLRTRTAAGSTQNDLSTLYQLELGNQKTEYEPYGKDEWYIKKAIGKVVLNGSENWQNWSTTDTNYSHYQLDNAFVYNNTSGANIRGVCNFYPVKVNGNPAEISLGLRQVGDSVYRIYLTTLSTLSTLSNFKTWLSTHNTILYYVLSTPTYTKITNTDLIEQLNTLQNTYLFKGQTNITVNGELPAIIDFIVYKNNMEGMYESLKDTVIKLGETDKLLAEKNVMTANASSNQTLSTTSWTKVPVELTASVGDKLEISNDGIKVLSAGTIMVSANILFSTGGTSSTRRGVSIYQNDTSITYCNIKGDTTYTGASITPLLIPVSANDIIYLYAINQGASGSEISAKDTYLNVEVVK